MTEYEAVSELTLANGRRIDPGDLVDSKLLRSDVSSLIEQGHIKEPGMPPMVDQPQAPYVTVDLEQDYDGKGAYVPQVVLGEVDEISNDDQSQVLKVEDDLTGQADTETEGVADADVQTR